MLFDAGGIGISVIRTAHQPLIAASSVWACSLVFLQAFAIAWFVLGFEVFEVTLVMRIVLCLLILRQLGVVVIFHCLTFALVRRLVVGSEYLPSLADRLGNLGEAQVFSFEMLSYLIRKENVS